MVWCMHACYFTSVISDSLRHYGLQLARLLCPWESPSKNTRVGCHPPNPGIKPAVPALQANSLPLSHWGSLIWYGTLIYFQMLKQPCISVISRSVSHVIPFLYAVGFHFLGFWGEGVWELSIYIHIRYWSIVLFSLEISLYGFGIRIILAS